MNNARKPRKFSTPLKTDQSTDDTQRIVLGVEYDGSTYHGWQRQSHAASVQASLEKTLSTVADHNVEVNCAGRTDTGVHATFQVVHFECSNKRPEKAWLKGVNSLLPASIAVWFASVTNNDFHARFSATSRSYTYVIDNSRTRPAIMHQGITWYNRKLDSTKINSAAGYLLGENDFTSFRSSQCQSNSANRCVTRLECKRIDNYVVISVTANAFLHHMVRNIVGLMLEIGDGRKCPDWAKEVLEARDRTIAGITAPAKGLYLTSVTYPEHFNIPIINREPLFMGKDAL